MAWRLPLSEQSGQTISSLKFSAVKFSDILTAKPAQWNFDQGFPPGYLEMKWSWHWNPCQHILPVLHIIIHFYFLFSSYHAALVFACRNAVLVTQIFPLPLTDVPLLYSVPGFDIWSSLTTRTVFTHYLGLGNHCSCLQKHQCQHNKLTLIPFQVGQENSRLS